MSTLVYHYFRALRTAFRTSNEANFRTSAYEAITSYVTHASADVIAVVQNTLITILVRMEQLLGMQVCDIASVSMLVLSRAIEPNCGCRRP